MLILGVESSCDETAAAVVESGRRILSDVVASQIAVHTPYGGVVPEIASRKHVEAILPTIESALVQSGFEGKDVDAVAAAQGPGLVGALLVGISAAKAMAYALDKPLLAVSHIEGHIHSAFLGREPIDKYMVCLVVSGGHTALYEVDPEFRSRLLGTTRDDAAGEAFDKVAKLLGLGYPGGVVIDRLAQTGDPHAIPFPRAYLGKDSLDFSFSGIKTAVAGFLRRFSPVPGPGSDGSESFRVEDVVAGFQEAVVDVLVDKTMKAAEGCVVSDVAVVGGVAANRRLRQRMEEEASRRGLRLHLPLPRYCTDNAAMIAAAGYSVWRRQGFCRDPLDLDARSRWLD